MASDVYTLLVVGHSVGAKVDVANSLLGHTEIAQFQKQLTVKHMHRRFVAGKIQVCTAANLDTPSWKAERQRIKKKYKNIIFVYVKEVGGFQINDEKSTKNIADFFGQSCNMILVIYHNEDNDKIASEKCESLSKTFRNQSICLKSSLRKELKVDIANQIVCVASNIVMFKAVKQSPMKPKFHGTELFDVCRSPTVKIALMTQTAPGESKQKSSHFLRSASESPQGGKSLITSLELPERLDSFNSWSSSIQIAPVLLATAGFLYTGIGDKCQCFECGVCLTKWSADHDPWLEHIRASPQCSFLKQFWGDSYMQNAEKELLKHKKSKDVAASENYGNVDVTEAVEREKVQERPKTPDNIHIEVEDIHWDLYFQTLTENNNVPSYHTRVNIIGFQGAGKTSLLRRLQDMDLDLKNPPDPTEGLVIDRSVSRAIDHEGKRYWETRKEGYDVEMNYERMAVAMKALEPTFLQSSLKIKDTRQPKADYNRVCAISDEADMESEPADIINVGSEEFIDPDNEIKPERQKSEEQTLYQMQNKLTVTDEKEEYLQNVLRKKSASLVNKIYLTYWDFAGQTTYYTTHQAFMSPSAVYLLVVDLSLPLDSQVTNNLLFRTHKLEESTVRDTIKFWIGSIKAYTTDRNEGTAPVIVVGTHKDKVSQKTIDDAFDAVRAIIQIEDVACIAIDNTLPAKDDTNLKQLRDKLIDDGLGIIEREIPASWLRIESSLLKLKAEGRIVVSFQELAVMCSDLDLQMKHVDLKIFLEYEHCNGFLMFFPKQQNQEDGLDGLRPEIDENIVLDPGILVNIINILLRKYKNESPNKGWCSDGQFNSRHIVDSVDSLHHKDMTKESIQVVIQMLTHLNIVYPKSRTSENDRYYMPCLFQSKPNDDMVASNKRCEKTPEIKFVFNKQYLPPASFHTLIALLLSADWEPYKPHGKLQLFNMYACFYIDNTSCVEMCWKKSSISIFIINFSRKKSLRELNCQNIVHTLKTNIYRIMQIYRQNTIDCKVLVCCPEHRIPPSYIALEELEQKGEAMCASKDGDSHAITAKEALSSWYWNTEQQPQIKENSLSNEPVNERLLSRLTKKLRLRDDANSLAGKLDLVKAWDIALLAKDHSYDNHQIQLFHVLVRWKQEHLQFENETTGSPDERRATVGRLTDLLTRLQVYTEAELNDVMFKNIPSYSYDIDEEILQREPTDRQFGYISSHLTEPTYVFLFIELGLTNVDIQNVKIDNRDNTREVVERLLIEWRRRYHDCPAKPTIRSLLDTANWLEMSVEGIVTELRKKQW